jgi:hypothetical protein
VTGRQAEEQIGRQAGAGWASPGLLVCPSPSLTAILIVLFFGPLIAPLFQATHLPLVAESGALARDMLSRYICPTPAKSYVLLGFPMAVCARCWGATIGLWAAWLLLRGQGVGYRGQGAARWRLEAGELRFIVGYLRLAWPLRLLVSATPFLLWVAEIRWWLAAPLWLLLLNGALAGFWAGLFFCSIWPGLLGDRMAERAT